ADTAALEQASVYTQRLTTTSGTGPTGLAYKISPMHRESRLQMPASDYMRERIWHGFIDDTAAGFAIPYVGAGRVLCGSDFPHIRSIGPDADATVARLIASLPAHEQEMVVGGNAAEVFRLGR